VSLAVPLVVHIGVPGIQRCITSAVREVSFRTVVPGGYASLSLDLDRPVSDFSPEIGALATVQLSDARHGGIVWEGRLEDPGRSNDQSGGHRRILAAGPSAFFYDDARPQIWVDSSEENWRKWNAGTATEVQYEVEDDSPVAAGAGILQSFNAGTAAAPSPPRSKTWGAEYVLLLQTAQLCGSVRASHAEGFTNGVPSSSGGYQLRLLVDGDGTGAIHDGTSTSVRSFDQDVFGQELRLQWSVGAMGSVALNEAVNCWFRHAGIVVKPWVNLKTGTYQRSARRSDTVASEIVGDLLGGGRLPLIDGPGAAIAADVNSISQFAYPTGVTAGQALNDLMLLEPDRFWAAWETNTAGKHRFEWAAWPTTVRYEASVADGFESPGSTAEVYNQVHVQYRDPAGRDAVVSRYRAVPSLDALGIVRSTVLTLDSNVANTEITAAAAGDLFLAEHAYPVAGGTLRISRPILDRTRGRMVLPHELLPGSLVALTDAAPASAAAINTTTRDGISIFRIVAVDYRSSDATAELSLDTNVRTTEQRVADLAVQF
jgi:hypothetical protein